MMAGPKAENSPRAAIVAVVAFAICALAAWRWQKAVSGTAPIEPVKIQWERVKDDFPMVQENIEFSASTQEAVQAVIEANPFSSKRRLIKPTQTRGQQDDSTAADLAAKPLLIYKGRVNIGGRQRAIVEESGSHKTYFLEVGQEVAGLKVLDIDEKRVVLSDLQTREEVVVSLATALKPTSTATKPEAKPGGGP